MNHRYAITRNGVRYVVELTMDMDAIAIDMVNRAARNSSGKASTMYGAIVAKIIEKEPAK